MTTVLAVGAHPDDWEIGVAGTLARHVEAGDEVFALVLTDGENGGADPLIRRKEAKEAAEIIGLEGLFFGGIPDGCLRDDITTVRVIEARTKQTDAKIIYCHSLHERHQDHRYAHNATVSATRRAKAIYAFETPSAFFNTVGFSPTHFVRIEKYWRMKRNALACHRSQVDRLSFEVGAIRAEAVLRGYQAAPGERALAEAFEVVRSTG